MTIEQMAQQAERIARAYYRKHGMPIAVESAIIKLANTIISQREAGYEK